MFQTYRLDFVSSSDLMMKSSTRRTPNTQPLTSIHPVAGIELQRKVDDSRNIGSGEKFDARKLETQHQAKADLCGRQADKRR